MNLNTTVPWSSLVLTKAVLGLVACGGEYDSTATFEPARSDSAGVEVVEYDGELPDRTAFEVEEVFRYGYGPDEYLFELVYLGGLQPDGSAVVIDVGGPRIVRIAAGGTGHSVVVGPGEGPNEIRGPGAMFVEGQDSIWIDDDRNGKLMRLVGGAVDTSLPTLASHDLTYGLHLVGRTPDGDFLGVTGSYDSRFEQPWLEGHLKRLDRETLALDTVGTYDLASRRIEGEINPFGHIGVVTASGGQFVIGRTDRPELVWRDADGTVTRILRWRPEPEYPTEADWEAFQTDLARELERVNPQHAGAEVDAIIERSIARYRFDPESPLPHFGRLIGDGEGGVWLSTRSSLGMEPREYHVIGADGAWQGHVTFPERFDVMDIRGDLVLGQVRDEMEVQGIAVYRFVLAPLAPSPIAAQIVSGRLLDDQADARVMSGDDGTFPLLAEDNGRFKLRAPPPPGTFSRVLRPHD